MAILICIEGIDTAGKSTQISMLRDKLEKEGLKVNTVHFPRYHAPIGNLISSVLNRSIPMDKGALQLLYIADFYDAKQKLTEMAMEYDVVILDRYYYSTIAYGKAGKALSVDNITRNIVDLYEPSVTIILDLPAEEVARRKEQLDLHESNVGFLKDIREAYKSIKDMQSFVGHNIKYIDAMKSKEEISNIIYEEVRKRTWEI